FVQLQRVPLGFEPAGVLAARISLPRTAYQDGARMSQFYRELVESLAADPVVNSVAVATSAPFAPGIRRGLVVGKWPGGAGAPPESVAEHIVSGGYFRTLAIPMVAGRSFDERDGAGSAHVVIVSEAVARQLWPGVSPIGQQLERDGRPHDVIGVAGDVRGASD